MNDRDDHPLLAGLTAAQRDAVATVDGPLLILAGPGSGKTRVITRRTAYLLTLGVPPWQILALTFTNKAAGEMRERVDRLLEQGPPARGLTISTFHALCARLLRRYAPMMEGAPRWGVRGDYTIYDTDDQTSLMKRVIADLGLTTGNWSPRTVLGQISAAKNQLQDAAAFAAGAADFHSKMIARLYDAYERGLRHANAVDFDDLLMLSVRMLRENADVRNEVQARWKYLMIDEYQDTNHAQFVLSTMLVGESAGEAGASDASSVEGLPGIEDDEPAAPDPAPRGGGRRNVCVVGDPDQSIYGWRGADIANILSFEEQYPGAKVIALGENFRSTAPILRAADGLIRHNKRRKHKPLIATRGDGHRPEVILCRDEHHEAAVVVDWIRALREFGAAGGADGSRSAPAWKDFAIFYRNNALSRVVEDALRQAGMPHVIVRGTAFYQREEVKDAVAYLRVVANPADEVSLRRIVNKPARKLGTTSIEKLAEAAAASGRTLMDTMRDAARVGDLTPAAAGAARRFVELVDQWTGGGSFMGASVPDSLPDLVSRVISESGLEGHYRALRDKGNEEDAERLANLEEIVSSARDFQEQYDAASDPASDLGEARAAALAGPDGAATPPLLALLRAYLERVSLVADADAVDPASGAITLMTLHAAKGLEFPAVAMIGLEEGLLPSMRAMENDPGEPEEERRLCFVGITRAMQRLLITSAKYRSVRGLRERTIPSRFIAELPAQDVIVSDQSESWEEDDFIRRGIEDDQGPSRRPDSGPRSPAARKLLDTFGGSSPRSPGSAPRTRAPVDDPQFPAGCKVRHPQFGVGTVREVSGLGVNRRATIAFLQAGTKTLILQYAKLERV
ncbi:MAG: UvrD-helicase domain-containing protein [Planctomycetota bacterium]|nr:UvrD-helicase domain-containing protein [Planctomycetota bacterium]